MSAETDQAAAEALRAAARLLDRMRRLGNTPQADLTDRQREEYAKFISYGDDTPRWLRDLADRTSKITPAREYSIAFRPRGENGWRWPLKGDPTWAEKYRGYDALARLWKRDSTIEEAKLVSRTKAGTWEFEEEQ